MPDSPTDIDPESPRSSGPDRPGLPAVRHPGTPSSAAFAGPAIFDSQDPPGAHPPLQALTRRRQGDRAARTPEGLLRLAEQLLAGDTNPLTVEGRRNLALREVPHFYSPLVAGPVREAIKRVVENGGRLYLQGLRSGVGTTMLIADYVTTFNVANARVGDGRQILHVNIAEGTSSARRLLDDIGLVAQVPLSASDLSARGLQRLLALLTAGMRSLRATTLVLDHVHFLGPKVLPLLKTIIDATDPAKTGRTANDLPAAQEERLGVILVSHMDPRHLFRSLPAVRHALRGSHAMLPAYSTVEAVVEALRLADIGLDDVTLSNPGDAALAARVLELTDGLPVAMEPLFQLLDALSLRNDRARPDLEMVELATEYYSQELMLGRRKGRARRLGAIARDAMEGPDGAGPAAESATAAPSRDVDAEPEPADRDADAPATGAGGARTRGPRRRKSASHAALDGIERAERATRLKALNRERATTNKIKRDRLRAR